MDWKETVLVLFFIFNSILDIKDRKVSLGSCVFIGVIGVSILLYDISCGLYADNMNMFCAGMFDGTLGGFGNICVFLIMMLLCRCILGILVIFAGYKGLFSIGGGDGMVIMTIGIFQGVMGTIRIVFWGLFLSAILGICLMIAGKVKRNTELPFVPFLFLGYILCIV